MIIWEESAYHIWLGNGEKMVMISLL